MNNRDKALQEHAQRKLQLKSQHNPMNTKASSTQAPQTLSCNYANDYYQDQFCQLADVDLANAMHKKH